MNGYYSVFDPTGKKIADCGSIKDAVNLIGTRGDGHNKINEIGRAHV